MKMQPMADRLVVRPLTPEESTEGGLIIPDTAQEKPLEAIVIAVGPGRYNEATGVRIPVEINPGDRILYSKYAGAEFKLDGEDVLLVQEEDVLARLVDDDIPF